MYYLPSNQIYLLQITQRALSFNNLNSIINSSYPILSSRLVFKLITIIIRKWALLQHSIMIPYFMYVWLVQSLKANDESSFKKNILALNPLKVSAAYMNLSLLIFSLFHTTINLFSVCVVALKTNQSIWYDFSK